MVPIFKDSMIFVEEARVAQKKNWENNGVLKYLKYLKFYRKAFHSKFEVIFSLDPLQQTNKVDIIVVVFVVSFYRWGN